jgi:deoxyribodipyrimidine photo-lyase
MLSQKSTQGPWGIHWFRRDLRICGNEALRDNWIRNQGRVLGLFCLDSQLLSHSDFSHNRFAFLLKTLDSLRQELREQGGDLLIVAESAPKTFPKLVDYLKRKSISSPSLISWCRDYEPSIRQGDEQTTKLLQQLGVETQDYRDHLLFEPHEILKNETKGASDFYQIFSPYGRKWFACLNQDFAQKRLRSQAPVPAYYERLNSHGQKLIFHMKWDTLMSQGDFPFADSWAELHRKSQQKVTIPIPNAGAQVAQEKLLEFMDKIENYKVERDFPAIQGTSRLSIYLKNGSLVSSQVLAQILPRFGNLNWHVDSGLNQFVKEIAWREFYFSILFHRPDVESRSFLPQYENLAWENNPQWFKKWKEGMTGFPIIDAGMRELNETGWMHNRVRMIVASFLTKDLLIDWRWGESYFMKMLLDGDLAANNGGWQWAASTGCDPQPYFRIFNPWLQSKKFDPQGTYIKTFVKELRDTPSQALHDPKHSDLRKGYPKPMVSHEEQRPKALRLYNPIVR